MTAPETTISGKCQLFAGRYLADINNRLEQLDRDKAVRRLWDKDSSLWTGADESNWLGWLTIVAEQQKQEALFKGIMDDVANRKFKHALLIGMGGSSLCVEVLRRTFGVRNGYPDMFVIDSTVPAQVLRTRNELDLRNTLFIVASKSGGTTEPNVLMQYFYDLVKKEVGDKAGDQFVAITDPGSSMEQVAKKLKFHEIYYGVPAIGGRFSALSNFGMVPSAVMGYDIKELLDHAKQMVDACAASVPARENPGAVLGAVMGELALKGVDKVTVITSPGISSLSAWLEQLIAESTGKLGRGLIPIAEEKLEPASKYGKDRQFVYVRLANAPEATQDKAVKELIDAGFPVVTIELKDTLALPGEFFRWEFATAVAGIVLGINAFDQPNVQESKDFTKKYLAEYNEKGQLPEDILLLEEDGIKIYVDEKNKSELETHSSAGLDAVIKAHLSRINAGDYFAINAYIDRTPELQNKLQNLRSQVLESKSVATTVGFGPRFLHSTGQLHKGGPNSGVFLQVTSDDAQDLPIPDEKFTFGILKQAQALGDFLALSKRDRRLLRVHLPGDVDTGLARLNAAFNAALK